MTERIDIIGDNDTSPTSSEEFYKKFKQELEEIHHFPCNYVYKFIVPCKEEKIALIHSIFENTQATFSSRDSKSKKYTSITVNIPAKDANEVIRFYQEVASIPDVVLL